jgi:kelch-like protein 10
MDTLTFLHYLETITQKDGEIEIREFARPHIPHEILFSIGGWSEGGPTNYIETYDTRAHRWVKVEEVDPAGPRAFHGTTVKFQHLRGLRFQLNGLFELLPLLQRCQ